MRLADVDITDYAYPCIAYALRRTGCGDARPVYPLPDAFERFAYSEESLRVGDIVAWEKEKQESDCTLVMRDGIPVTAKVHVGIHFGVYEGKGLVSDISYCGDSIIPYLRVRDISTVKDPRWIYRRW